MTDHAALDRIDIDQVRAETPGIGDRVHVNNAGASPPPAPVLDAVLGYLREEASVGGYEIAEDRVADLDRVYAEAGALLGCDEHELAFQQNATQAWCAAFNSVPLESGDRVLATTSEYVTAGIALVRARNSGVSVELIPDDEHGQTSVDALADMLDERVKLVCATHVPTSGGLINPVEAIGAAVKQGSDALYLLDACQSVGQLPLDVRLAQADFVSFTGRKFCRAPRGTGMLYQRDAIDGLRAPVVNDGWGNEWTGPWSVAPKPGARNHEVYEYAFAAKAGFGVALAYLNELGIENVSARTVALADELRAKLDAIDGVQTADRGVHRSAIVTFAVGGRSPQEVRDVLTARSINSSLAKPAAAQFDLADRAPEGLVRVSPHYFNTIDELDLVAEAVAEASSEKMS